MVEHQQESFATTTADGSEITYDIRGLDEAEIGPWAVFCASVFSYKANPPPASYFERHYENDPYRDKASLIRVALFEGEIVASCRLFLRTISGGSHGTLAAGGIGEVCTSERHRRRGLSKILLQNVIAIMQERKVQVSLLHAAPAFFPVYEKAGGYVCSKSCWSVVQVDVKSLEKVESSAPESLMRQAIFPEDTSSLSALHQKYSEQRFVGCIVRSEEYWNEYLSVELGDSLSVLAKDEKILAWLSLRPRGERMQLREFGLDESSIGASEGLGLLLWNEIRKTGRPENFALVLPTTVLEQVRSDQNQASYLQWETVTPEDDMGWMYKILDEQIEFATVGGNEQPHLIWPADSF